MNGNGTAKNTLKEWPSIGYPHKFIRYEPKGKKYLGTPLKWWEDCFVMPI